MPYQAFAHLSSPRDSSARWAVSKVTLHTFTSRSAQRSVCSERGLLFNFTRHCAPLPRSLVSVQSTSALDFCFAVQPSRTSSPSEQPDTTHHSPCQYCTSYRVKHRSPRAAFVVNTPRIICQNIPKRSCLMLIVPVATPCMISRRTGGGVLFRKRGRVCSL